MQERLPLFADEEMDAMARAATILGSRKVSLTRLLDSSYVIPPGVEDGETAKVEERGKVDDLYAGDPALPLRDSREESFVLQLVDGVAGYVAYREAFQCAGTNKSCSQQASRVSRRARVAARLIWLRKDRIRREKAAVVGAAGEGEDGPGAPAGGVEDLASLEGIRGYCRQVIRDARAGKATAADALRAVELLRKMTEEEQGQKKGLDEVDPVDLLEYFRRAGRQGIDPKTWAEEQARSGVGAPGGKESAGEGQDPSDIGRATVEGTKRL